jgi:hypothetical protein
MYMDRLLISPSTEAIICMTTGIFKFFMHDYRKLQNNTPEILGPTVTILRAMPL